jgi:aminoglycoside phosphotransferase (APT) family kinase protein
MASARGLQDYLVIHYPNASISDFTYLSGGWECDIYAFTLTLTDGKPRDLILRLYMGNDGVEKTAHEGGGLRQLFEAGYPVPETFLYETDSTVLGNPFIIMEKLDGQGLWAAMSNATRQQESQLLDQFGRLIAQLHRLDWRPFTEQAARYQAIPGAVLDDLLASYRRLYSEFEVEGFLAILDWLETHKTAISAQPAVVHLDFHANNIFLHGDGRMTVIDWSQITVADYRCDLSWTLMIMGDHGKPGWREHILDAYIRAAGHPVEQLDYFNVISYTKLLASTVISLRVGPEKLEMRPETIETMKQQGDSIKLLSRRIHAITGVTVSEVQTLLDQIGE